MAEEKKGDMQLGKQISLTGFHDLDSMLLIPLKKNLVNKVKKISERSKDFRTLKLVMKKLHHTDGSDLFAVKGRVNDGGKVFSAEHTDRDVLLAVRKVLEKLEQEMRYK